MMVLRCQEGYPHPLVLSSSITTGNFFVLFWGGSIFNFLKISGLLFELSGATFSISGVPFLTSGATFPLINNNLLIVLC